MTELELLSALTRPEGRFRRSEDEVMAVLKKRKYRH
jgi:hypothetical protein